VPSLSCNNATASTSAPHFLVSPIRTTGAKRLRIGAVMSLKFSPSPAGARDAKYGLIARERSCGIKGKGIVAAEEEEDLVVASAASSGEAFVSAPVKSVEQEAFAKEWAHEPRRVVLFVEPSPFSCVLPCISNFGGEFVPCQLILMEVVGAV